jgi:hypothetical protein
MGNSDFGREKMKAGWEKNRQRIGIESEENRDRIVKESEKNRQRIGFDDSWLKSVYRPETCPLF